MMTLSMDGENSPFEPLGVREHEILTLMSEGLEDREIAARLFLSVNTVKWHNRHIYQKLGAENRKQAVQRARSFRLVDGEAEVPPHNLPAQVTPFVGRVSEIESLINLLNSVQPRLLTLLAPGGMGKTRLALAAAESVLSLFADGVFFVALAPLDSHTYLVSAIAEAVECPTFADDRTPMQRLCDFLRRKQVLLILDNFEHLLDGAPDVGVILHAATHVKIMVTTRERLNLSGEAIYPVEGLRYPVGETPENAGEYGAVRLFIDTAQRANPQFAAPDTDIVRVCRLVQGMPLALELAAAWAGALTAAEIGDEITRSTDFLATSTRDVPDRLRSIRAVFEAAWGRLGAAEQRAFAAMSVFRGGCTREAALAVTSADNATLAGMAHKALLRRDPQTGRYEIHELLRQYAEARLMERGEAEGVNATHQAYFAAFTEDWAEKLKTQQLKALDVLEPDVDNIRLAFDRAIAVGTPDVLLPFTGMWYFYDVRGRWQEGITILDAATDAVRGADSLALAKLLMAGAVLRERLDLPWEERRPFAQGSVEMLRRIGAEHELPLALNMYGAVASGFDPLLSDALFVESYDLAVKHGDAWAICFATYALGVGELWRKNLDEAARWLTDAHGMAVRIQNYWALCHTFAMRARLYKLRGDYEEAQRMNRESLNAAQRIGHPNVMFDAYLGLLLLALESGDFTAAKRHAEAMVAVERNLGRMNYLYDGLSCLAEACIGMNEIEEAKQHLSEAINIGRLLPSHIPFDIFRVASDLFIVRGAYESACRLLTFIDSRPEFEKADDFFQRQLAERLNLVHAALSPEQRALVAETTRAESVDALMVLASVAL